MSLIICAPFNYGSLMEYFSVPISVFQHVTVLRNKSLKWINFEWNN